MSKQDILDYFSDINYAYNDSTRFDTFSRMLEELVEQAAYPWHRMEEPPKYSGKVFVWMEREGNFFDKEYIADVAYYNNLAGGRIPKGTFFKPIPGKMEYEILDNVTHWMPIEPPREDA